MMGRMSCKRGSVWENDGGADVLGRMVVRQFWNRRDAWEDDGEDVLTQEGMFGGMTGRMF
jgi:hypothetical protein